MTLGVLALEDRRFRVNSIPTPFSISLYLFEVAKMSRTKVLEAPSVITSLGASRARLDDDFVFTLHGTSSSPFVVSHGGWSSCSSIQAAYLYAPFSTQALAT